jgi:hypothetical protein
MVGILKNSPHVKGLVDAVPLCPPGFDCGLIVSAALKIQNSLNSYQIYKIELLSSVLSSMPTWLFLFFL